jgi:hypothetical protein
MSSHSFSETDFKDAVSSQLLVVLLDLSGH